MANPIDTLRAQVDAMLDQQNPDSPIGSTVAFSVLKNKEADFEKLAAVLTAATRALPGCVAFGFHPDIPITPDPIGGRQVEHLIYEDWESVRQFRGQWDSQHLKDFQYAVIDMVAGPPDLKFHGGMEGGQRVRLLRTGQKYCWDAQGNRIGGNGSGQDGDVQAGVASPDPRFTDNNNGTVTDNLTGLVWLKNANAFGEVSWAEAIQIARSLCNGEYGLSDDSSPGDWRMPNVNEFQSLLDLNNTSGSALPPTHLFLNATPANYWSCSSVLVAPPLGWYCALAVGPPVFDLKFNSMRMLPVRGTSNKIAKTGQVQCFDAKDPFAAPTSCAGTGQDGDLQYGAPWPIPRFTDNGNGSVTDNLTGLIWLKDAGRIGTKSWGDALEACSKLAADNRALNDGSMAGDWRLPNLFELRSLVDYSQHSPALPLNNPFQNVRTSLYWSSTTVASAPNLARFVFIGIGPSVWDHKSVMLNVWPVRGGK
jgi:quinol monooxygenase YgiN